MAPFVTGRAAPSEITANRNKMQNPWHWQKRPSESSQAPVAALSCSKRLCPGKSKLPPPHVVPNNLRRHSLQRHHGAGEGVHCYTQIAATPRTPARLHV
eukprot:4876932-Alexandrium_andersonii.AAC.1